MIIINLLIINYLHYFIINYEFKFIIVEFNLIIT